MSTSVLTEENKSEWRPRHHGFEGNPKSLVGLPLLCQG